MYKNSLERMRSMKEKLIPIIESVRAKAERGEPTTSNPYVTSPAFDNTLKRDEHVRSVLKNELIDISTLRMLVASGDIEECMRPIVWRLLLGYLPNQRHKWDGFLEKQRETYEQLVYDLIVERQVETPSDSDRDESDSGPVKSDHPLNTSETSNWSQYFKDNEMLNQIDKDVRRLCPEMAFFQQPTMHPCKAVVARAEHRRLSQRIQAQFADAMSVGTDRSGLKNLHAERKCQILDQYQPLAAGEEAHWEVVERILFLYYKLNPGVKYVQGMNEVLGPLYYVLANDRDIEWSKYAEADTFYCYQNLLSEIKDHFIKHLDCSSVGIESTMTRMLQALELIDKQVHSRFEELQLVPQYYAFRWLSLLLSQEFHMPDVICIWDALFADESRFDLLIFFCVAMIVNIREDLLVGEFSDNMKMLQNYPSCDVAYLIRLALKIQNALAPTLGQGYK